ncbi:uncharacterized protein LOC113780204 [Coffea eugenioides]|uniref:uncharacterized protein LOC113780204 n=1 Tax=Coffea eugenioides TaxID=49369 RepID=UPI000F6066F8|nr:uncharacterized protein LOC113780204 [Coffea eugenioides]
MRTAVDLINLSPSVPLDGDIPERVWTEKDVSFKHLRVLVVGLYDPIEKKVIRSRDLVFFEDQTIENIDKGDNSKSSDDIPASSISDPNSILVPVDFNQEEAETKQRENVNDDGGEPESYCEALEYENKEDWLRAMQPMTSLHENHTYDLVKLLKASLNLEIEQLDVKTAFLHGDLEEKIYMEQLEGFKESDMKNLVCHLKKSLYGLKQASRQWYKKFDSFMIDHGCHRTTFDHCVYVKNFSNGDFVILLLYVDDILIVGRDTIKIDRSNIAHAVGIVGWYLSNPDKEHWNAIK